MKDSNKKMWMNILSTALGVALGFGLYKAAEKLSVTKEDS
jgi:hypothetical protein|tara:strand:+ start:1605 stop:1724 length:120 start_codon:yes stop_codon:yes gene_type:complete